MKKWIGFLLFGFLCFCHPSTGNLNHISFQLEGEDWGIFYGENDYIPVPDFNAATLETGKLPNNLRIQNKAYRGPIWLRKNFEIGRDFESYNLALELGKVYQSDEVYINGVLIGKNGSPFGRNPPLYLFGVSRIYPIPHKVLQEGENFIAIKIESDLSSVAGIVTGPIRIVPNSIAIQDLLDRSLSELIYVGFYLFIALFFLINYFRMKSNEEYVKFSLLAFLFSLYELSKNEARFLLWDDFLILKLTEYIILLFLPYPFLRFIQEFFHVKPLPFQRFYLAFPALFVVIFVLIPKPVFWFNFIGYWDLHLIPILAYTLVLTIYKCRENAKGSWIHLVSLLYLLYAIFREIGIERGFLSQESNLDFAFLFYLLAMTIALRFQFLFTKRKIQNRFDRLKEADSLREKIFFYMDAMITNPLLKMKQYLQEIRETQDKKKWKQKFQEAQKIQETISLTMDDIMELSRLEVLKEIPFADKVNFNDFVKQLVSSRKITYAIKVEPDTEIETSLDLVNSIVIRLIDFPLFQEFSHNDLIITQDLKGNVHFRFLLFHSNPKISARVFQELNEEHLELNPLRVKWAIIQEITRLLQAKLDYQIIKKKYLKIDFGMKAITTPKVSVLEAIHDPKHGERLILKKILRRVWNLLSDLRKRIPKLKKRNKVS